MCSYWNGEQPDNRGPGGRAENCVEISIAYNDWLKNWNDLPCDEKRDFICEKSLQ